MSLQKYITVLFTFLWIISAYAQDAFHNYGNVKVHDNSLVGFHLNLINDGSFEQNTGLVGFYSEYGNLNVSGTNIPILFDAEVAVDGDLVLETPIDVINNVNLVMGDILTPRSSATIYSNFMDNSFYIGESNASKIDGYGAMMNKQTFVFPVGDETRIRPVTIESVAINAMAKCAYFFEDPNDSKSLKTGFSTNKKASEYISVNTKEFWRLEGDVPSNVTLTWDTLSDVKSLGEYLTDLKVVGWSKTGKQWENLGNTNVEGGIGSGSLTSEVFVPNDYEIITIGGNNDILETFDTIDLDNYFMTPNGDGANDVLVIEGIENSANNLLQIFDRYGVMVYSKTNYQSDFNGRSNRESVIKRDTGLASGIYFYILTMYELKQKHQGYLYISN